MGIFDRVLVMHVQLSCRYPLEKLTKAGVTDPKDKQAGKRGSVELAINVDPEGSGEGIDVLCSSWNCMVWSFSVDTLIFCSGSVGRHF